MHRKDMKHAKPTNHLAIKGAAVAGAVVTMPAASIILSTPAHAATAQQWDCIAQFESAGNWHIESGDPPGAPGTGASAWGGGLQFQPASWNDALDLLRSWNVDLSHFGTHASNSTKQQQILAAEALEYLQGPSAWATNGMSSCATLSPSMFSGGPNPWGLDGGRIPTSVINGTSGDAFPTDLSDGPSTPVTDPPVTTPPVTDPTPPASTPPHYWRNCTDAHRHGWWNFRKWSSGYRHALDSDHDGIACESWPGHDGGSTTPPVVTPPVTPTDPAPERAPAVCDHIVEHGDTVYAVALRNGASLADVEAVNPGIIAGDRPDDYSLIYAGGHIHMPAGFCDGNQ